MGVTCIVEDPQDFKHDILLFTRKDYLVGDGSLCQDYSVTAVQSIFGEPLPQCMQWVSVRIAGGLSALSKLWVST